MNLFFQSQYVFLKSIIHVYLMYSMSQVLILSFYYKLMFVIELMYSSCFLSHALYFVSTRLELGIMGFSNASQTYVPKSSCNAARALWKSMSRQYVYIYIKLFLMHL